MNFTKGEIDRLGDQIRQEGFELSEKTLEDLQRFRTSHKDSLAHVFQILCALSKQINIGSIVTYRIKRFESIIGKLYRHHDMRFSRMWDIAGCRCILKDDDEVYKLRDLIASNLTVRKVYDYIENPQQDGYRSLHLFVSLPDDDKVIEVQLRNIIDHNWATLVEITDLLFGTKLKEYGDHNDLFKFHFLLSKKENLNMGDKLEIAGIIRKYKYIEKLSEVFSRNYIQVRQQWLAIENRSNFKFFLIEANKDEVPKITSFSTFNDAEANYLSVYRTNQNANIVLTHLPKPKYDQISIAYSNYVLTYHSFLDDCYSILEDAIIDSLSKGNVWQVIKFYQLYVDTSFNYIKNLVSEIKETKQFGKKSSRHQKKKLTKKEREWLDDIKKEIQKRQGQQKKFSAKVNFFIPSNVWKRLLINQGFNYVDRKYKIRFKKLFAST
jgi:putative GTP pyrophosphokinase